MKKYLLYKTDNKLGYLYLNSSWCKRSILNTIWYNRWYHSVYSKEINKDEISEIFKYNSFLYFDNKLTAFFINLLAGIQMYFKYKEVNFHKIQTIKFKYYEKNNLL